MRPNHLIRTAGLLAPLALFAASEASAQVTYQYVAEQDSYTVNVDQTTVLPVNVYLLEDTGGGASQIAADGGLFTAGVRVLRDSGTATLTSTIDASPAFTSSNKTPGTTDASLFEDNFADDSGPSPDGSGRVFIGTFHIDVGSIVGQTSSFDLLDYSAVGDQLVTFTGRGLDGVTSPGSFSVTTVVPEPSGALLLLAVPAAALARRRRPAAR